jgi:hypothetical protein
MYFVFVEVARLEELIAELYGRREMVAEGALVECTKRVTTIEDEEEQRELVQEHHRGKTNQQGLNDMLPCLKREH